MRCFSFFESFGGKFGCKWVIKFMGSLNQGHLQFLDENARAHNFDLNGNSIRAIFFRRKV